jgi:hypothetical protein
MGSNESAFSVWIGRVFWVSSSQMFHNIESARLGSNLFSFLLIRYIIYCYWRRDIGLSSLCPTGAAEISLILENVYLWMTTTIAGRAFQTNGIFTHLREESSMFYNRVCDILPVRVQCL